MCNNEKKNKELSPKEIVAMYKSGELQDMIMQQSLPKPLAHTARLEQKIVKYQEFFEEGSFQEISERLTYHYAINTSDDIDTRQATLDILRDMREICNLLCYNSPTV